MHIDFYTYLSAIYITLHRYLDPLRKLPEDPQSRLLGLPLLWQLKGRGGLQQHWG